VILSAIETSDKPVRSVEAREALSPVWAVAAEAAPGEQDDEAEDASSARQFEEALVEALEEAPVRPVAAGEAPMLVDAVDAVAVPEEEDKGEYGGGPTGQSEEVLIFLLLGRTNAAPEVDLSTTLKHWPFSQECNCILLLADCGFG